jgi:hypothetical protein
MATRTVTNRARTQAQNLSFERFAGLCGMLAALTGLLYAVAFVVLKDTLLSGLFLMLGGIFSGAVLVALYYRVRETEAAFATWGVVLALVGALGATIHGGYDLANATNPPPPLPAGVADLPSQIDPRGLLTFGVSGLGLFVLSWLMRRSGRFTTGLVYLGFGLAGLSLILYLGRLIVLDAKSLLIVIPAVLAGFIINPLWYGWLGFRLWRGDRS